MDAFLRQLTVGKLQHRGTLLWQSGPPLPAILRICRCLSLRKYFDTPIHIFLTNFLCLFIVGVNNQNLQKDVLHALQPLKFLTAVHRAEYVR